MKRIWIVLIIAALLTGLLPVGVFADGSHPITLSIACDPMPELEGDGTIPSLLFTIRNESQTDYTLNNAKLNGGYENREMPLTDSILVLAGGTKEFELTDIPVAENQLDRDITYTLTWDETVTVIDPETGDATFITYKHEASASIRIDRFVVPELTVTAACDDEILRYGEPFSVEYTVRNDTEFDISGIRLYDPEQNMQPITIPGSDLTAGASFTVRVDYQMGAKDMVFAPRVEYISRRREMTSEAAKPLTVQSVVVDLLIVTEARPATQDGNTFAITVKNNGNRPVTDIQVYDEINTPIDRPFSLEPDEFRTVIYTVKPAISSLHARTVQFHAAGTDCLNAPVEVEDTQTFMVIPYVSPDSAQVSLSVVLQSPFYDDNGKLCATIQFNIRNIGDVTLYSAVLSELTLFGEVVSYPELRNGNTYYTQVYQLDGVKELKFRVDALDPAGNACRSEIIRLDLSSLKELADRKDSPVIVYPTNPYLSKLDAKYTGVLRVIGIIGLCLAGICTAICIVLYIVERRLRAKLPPEFEEDMERALRATKRRIEKQLFSDAPTEQFGYTAPIKLRNYGELTEEEAKERRALYERHMRETLRREQQAAPKLPERPAEPAASRPSASDGTQVFPVYRAPDRTAAFKRPEPSAETVRFAAEPDAKTYVPRAKPVEEAPEPDVRPYVPRTKPKEPIQEPDVKPETVTRQAAETAQKPSDTTCVFPAKPKPYAAPAQKPILRAPIRMNPKPRRIEEKPQPARRPVELHSIRRMNG